MEVSVLITGINESVEVLEVMKGKDYALVELADTYRKEDKRLNVKNSWYEVHTMEIKTPKQIRDRIKEVC